jgi:hypothetical protein
VAAFNPRAATPDRLIGSSVDRLIVSADRIGSSHRPIDRSGSTDLIDRSADRDRPI